MAFSSVLMIFSFEADDDTHDLVGVGERKNRSAQAAAASSKQKRKGAIGIL